jgi:hypothetical protein
MRVASSQPVLMYLSGVTCPIAPDAEGGEETQLTTCTPGQRKSHPRTCRYRLTLGPGSGRGSWAVSPRKKGRKSE